jgi:DNA invertase Pin-like site-specific DNA recombinase
MNNQHIQRISVAIYTRSATAEQAAPSKCDIQVTNAYDYIKETFFLPRINVKEYRDVSSGRSEIGLGLGRLLEDAQARKIDILIINGIDRLSRNFETNQLLHCTLRAAGVTLLTI